MAQTQPISESPEGRLEAAGRGVTLRAVGLGLFLVVGLDVAATYVKYYYRASLMTLSHVPMAMLMVFFSEVWWPKFSEPPKGLTPTLTEYSAASSAAKAGALAKRARDAASVGMRGIFGPISFDFSVFYKLQEI